MALAPLDRRALGGAFTACALLTAAVAGVLVVRTPARTALVVVGVVALFAALASSTARLVIVLFGGLFVFQSSSGVNVAKFGYLLLVVICAALSWWRVAAAGARQWLTPYTRIARATPLVVLPVVTSLFVAHGQGIPTTAWLRDVVAYAFLALLVPIALDAGSTTRLERLEAIFVAAGGVAAIGFASDWLQRRGVSSLAFGKFSLSSLALVAAPFAFALVRVGLGPGRLRWLLYTTALSSLVLVTGSRVGVVLFAAVFGIVGTREKGRVPLPRLAAVLPAVAVLVAIAVATMGALAIANPGFLRARLASAEQIIRGTGSSDQSLQERKIEYSVANRVIAAHPILGVGPGYQFVNLAEASRTKVTVVPSLDTPLTTPAKLGWVGFGLLVGFLGAYAGAFRGARRVIGPSTAITAMGGFAAVVVLESPFGDVLGDKGFPLALMCLLAIAVAESRRAVSIARSYQPPRTGRHIARPPLAS